MAKETVKSYRKERISDIDFQDLADQFRKIRTELNMTDWDVEKTVGKGRKKLITFEEYRHNPTVLTFLKWCQVLGVRIHLTK